MQHIMCCTSPLHLRVFSVPFCETSLLLLMTLPVNQLWQCAQCHAADSVPCDTCVDVLWASIPSRLISWRTGISSRSRLDVVAWQIAQTCNAYMVDTQIMHHWHSASWTCPAPHSIHHGWQQALRKKARLAQHIGPPAGLSQGIVACRILAFLQR